MEKRLKNKRGITLIALVVTIIILIILAGISINLVLGDNGILKRARYAKDREAIVGLREEAEMVLAKREMDRIDGDTIALKEDLEQGIQGEKIVEEATVGDTIYPDTCYVTRNGHTITVYEDGTSEEGRIEIWDGSSKTKPEIDENRNWHIYTANEMKYFADFVNGYLTEEEKGDLTIEETTIVYLENNLDLGARQADGVLQKGTEWEPVGGRYETKLSFDTTFEGNGHSIKGLYVNSKEENDCVGLFGKARIIQNLTIKDSYVKGLGTGQEDGYIGGIVGRNQQITNCHNVNTEVSGVKYVGGVAGWSTLIEDCSNSGNISGEEYCIGGIAEYAKEIKRCYNSGKVTGKADVGGIAGECLNISECENTGTVTGGSEVGGISGWTYTSGVIAFCVNNGEVKSSGEWYDDSGEMDSRVGGIVGATVGERVSYCSNTGFVSGKGFFVGGIIGLIPTDGSDPSEKIGTRVEYCNNSGMIKGEGQGTGGIVGQVAQYKSSIQACYNSGTIEGNTWTGGLAGGVGRSSSVMNSWNKGDVKGNKQVGGLVGVTYFSSSTMKNCYTIGKINGVNEVGGVLGRKQNSEPMIENCYYLQGTTSQKTNEIGEEKTEEEMKSQEFLDNLNNGLEGLIWEFSTENNGYPTVKVKE